MAICSDDDDPMKQSHKEEELRNVSVGWMDALPEGVDIGNYVFAFEVLHFYPKLIPFRLLCFNPGLKSKYATGGRTNVSVHVTGVVKVDNAKVALLEGDSVESEKKLDLPGKNDVALSANYLQKLNLSFLLTTPFGKNSNLIRGVIGLISPSLEKLEIHIVYDVAT
ncbi:dolichyl-diphosphooligosaccharide--protein glycosyltransferase subunit 2-like protein [Tanacetum coccineum]